MKTLAIDTTTELGSVALLDGGALVAEAAARVRARQGEVLLPHVARVLETARWTPRELELLVVTVGPGSFTGLRVGMATAKGLALAGGTPLVGVGSLRVLAAAAAVGQPAGTMVAAVLDAHKGEVFFAAWLVSEGRGHDDASVLPAEDGDGDAGSGGGPGMAGVAGAVISPPAHAAPEDAGRRLREDAERVGAERVLWVGDGVAVHRAALTAGFAERDVGLPRKEAPGGAPAAASAPVLRFLPGWLGAPRAAWAGVLGQSDFRRRGPDDLGRLEPRYVRGSDARLPANPTASRAGGG